MDEGSTNFETISVCSTLSRQNTPHYAPLQKLLSDRSYYSVMAKINENVESSYNEMLKDFSELLNNDKIVESVYGTKETNSSWKKDAEELNDEELKKAISILQVKIARLEKENEKLKSENDELFARENLINEANNELLDEILNNN